MLDSVNTLMAWMPYIIVASIALPLVITLLIVVPFYRNGSRNRRLLQTGELAAAVIVELRDTGVTVNQQPQIELVLDVLPPNRPPFRATTRTLISRLQTSQVQPGMQVLVKYNPLDLSNVALVTYTG